MEIGNSTAQAMERDEAVSVQSGTLSERFDRLPQMQMERQCEYEDQFNSANTIAKRLAKTRIEAEKVAQLEIERTKRMMEDEVSRHPDFVQFTKDLNDAQLKASRWDYEHQGEKRKLESELSKLKSQEKDAANRLDVVTSREGELYSERARLEGEVEDAKIRVDSTKAVMNQFTSDEESCSRSVGPIGSQIESIKTSIGSLGPKRSSIEKELQSARSRLQELETSVSSHRNRYSSTLEQINQLQKKLEYARSNLTAAQLNESQAKSLLESQQNDAEFFREQISNYSQRRKQHVEVENEFSRLLSDAEGLKARITSRRQEFSRGIEGLNNKRAALRREIERLMQEEADVIRQVEDFHNKMDMIPEEEARLSADISQIQVNLEAAKGTTAELDNSVKSYRETLADYERRLPGISKSLTEAREEVATAERLISQYIAQISVTERSSMDYQNAIPPLEAQIASTTNAIDVLTNDLASVTNTLDQNDWQLQELNQDFSRFQATWGELRNQKSAAERNYNESMRVYEELRRRYEAIPTITESPQLSDHLMQIRAQIADIEARFGGFPVTNPHIGEVDSLKRRAMEIRNQAWERVQANPSQQLRDQLAREAEAVMRAEATASLEKKQSEIVRGTEDLASLKLQSAPRLEVDNEASQVLLNELMEPRPRRHVFETVLNMCDQKHIRSASKTRT